MRKNKTIQIISYVLLLFATLFCSMVSAFEVSTTSYGKEIKWFNVTVPYSINTSGAPSGSADAITAAMQTWTDVPDKSFTFVYNGSTNRTEVEKRDGENIVCFGAIAETGVLAVNTFWFYPSTGQMIESDIKFNTNFAWSADGSQGKFDVQNVATHELGHSLSLEDLYGAADFEKTMYGYSSAGEIKQRTLDQDDINGIIYLYGNSYTTTTIATTSSVATTSIPVTTTTSIPPFREVEFTGSPLSGKSPLTVTFSNLSQGDITYQYWDFGDGSPVSFDANPIHKYKKTGTFTVTLITGFVGGSYQQKIKENYIAVESGCLFVSNLQNQAQVNNIRKLRTTLRDNLYWRELSIIYYRHFFEVAHILRQYPELRDEFRKLVSSQIKSIETLNTAGSATITEEDLEAIIVFLMQIREHGSVRLQEDIDAVIAGIDHTMLLEGLGIYKE
jgi:PKD repeat protein